MAGGRADLAEPGPRTADCPTAATPAGGYPEYERPGRFAATFDEDDESFLRRCRERAEEQRRRHREQGRTDEPGAES